ncbi:MAG: DUF3768 domain-containing protein [Xanthobacteraceae bacterium]
MDGPRGRGYGARRGHDVPPRCFLGGPESRHGVGPRHENDPYEEHDFGAFEAEGQVIFFKIDYHDPNLTRHSTDPADPNVTQRVITIMLAEEY